MCQSRSTESAPAEITPNPPLSPPKIISAPWAHLPSNVYRAKTPSCWPSQSRPSLCVSVCVSDHRAHQSSEAPTGPGWTLNTGALCLHARWHITGRRLIAAAVTAGNISLFVRTRHAPPVGPPPLCFVSVRPLVPSSKRINKKQQSGRQTGGGRWGVFISWLIQQFHLMN